MKASLTRVWRRGRGGTNSVQIVPEDVGSGELSDSVDSEISNLRVSNTRGRFVRRHHKTNHLQSNSCSARDRLCSNCARTKGTWMGNSTYAAEFSGYRERSSICTWYGPNRSPVEWPTAASARRWLT